MENMDMDTIVPSVQEDKPAGPTRGPCKIDFGHPRGLPGGISVAKGGRPVTRFNAFARPSTPEALANARLIAAAPCLLKALQELLGNAEVSRMWMDHDKEEAQIAGSALYDTILQAEAAISKALPLVSE